MSLKVFKLKTSSRHICKVPFAVPSLLAAWGRCLTGFSGLQEWTSSAFFSVQSRMLEHRCPLLLQISDFCA